MTTAELLLNGIQIMAKSFNPIPESNPERQRVQSETMKNLSITLLNYKQYSKEISAAKSINKIEKTELPENAEVKSRLIVEAKKLGFKTANANWSMETLNRKIDSVKK